MDTVFGITEEHVGGVPVVIVRGEIDLATAPELRLHLRDVASAGHASAVVDLTSVTFLDSTALGVLVGAQRRFREAGGQMGLVMNSPRLLKIFEVTGLTAVFEIAPTLEALHG